MSEKVEIMLTDRSNCDMGLSMVGYLFAKKSV